MTKYKLNVGLDLLARAPWTINMTICTAYILMARLDWSMGNDCIRTGI
ncbi:MAG: hypothetical protein ABJQ14_00035 [Hyphomicrobiales bacterium]